MATKNANNENKNVVANPEMEQFVNDNIGIVPTMMKKRFLKLTIEEQVKKIEFYKERQKWMEEYKEKNRVVNRVKEIFEKKKATVQDAKEVMKYCQDFLDSFKQREIEKLDEQIAKLEEMKKSLED